MSENAVKKIAILTSGGDCPGMNPCIRAAVRTALARGLEIYGVYDGLQGLIDDRFVKLEGKYASGLSSLGGTVLGTARSMEFMTPEGRAKAAANIRARGIEAVVVMGGDGSFRGGSALCAEHAIPFAGLPCTIDNDMYGTDYTIGFHTALNTIVEAVDKVRDTARSHHRLFFVETMGRHSGALAVAAAVATGADAVMIPETDSDLPALSEKIKKSFAKAHKSFIVIVAEGDEAGDAITIEKKVRELSGVEGRVCVLGHIQRGGAPCAFDRILASVLGYHAVNALCEGQKNIFVGVKNGKVAVTPIEEIIGKKKPIEWGFLEVADILCT
jgi:6-phosphofructokinase 1